MHIPTLPTRSISPTPLKKHMISTTLPTLLTLATIIPALQAASMNEAQITTTYPTKEKHPLALITDGKLDTYFQTTGDSKSGDTIQLSFPTPLPAGKTIRVHTGSVPSDDFLSKITLESSPDQQNWTAITTQRGSVLSATIPENTNHIRLRATADSSKKLAVREIKITTAPSPVLIQKGKASYQGKTYNLTIAANLQGHLDLKPRFKEMATLYFKVWPKLVSMMDSPIDDTFRDVDIYFKANIPYPAYANQNHIVISADHLQKNKEDTIGVFIHELTHVIQHYPTYNPSWFVEGSADYTRYKLNPSDAWATRHAANINHDKPLGHYWDTAAFLFYLEDTYNKEIMKPVSIAVRNNTYQETIWKDLTGKGLNQLTEDYKVSNWQITPKTK